MNGRNGPLSPVSLGGSEWSGISRHQTLETDFSYSNSRGQLVSPPISSGSNGTMNGGFPPRGSSVGSPGNPSPPSSIARSSNGTGLYSGMDRGRKEEQFEAILSEHYVALKRFLASSLRDEKGNPRPNRARDKLLRLSSVQFQELSTDVFDELLRRQQASRRPTTADGDRTPSSSLQPKADFHPKRNQARQKLSTLPPARFRDLATDVFYELERRCPRFAGGDISRVGSPVSSVRGPPSRNGNGTPVNGSRGPSRIRRPSDASSIAGYSIRSESRGRNGPPLASIIPPSPGLPPNDYGRPQPKTFQSSTIVPNKSTMIEDDETGGEDNDDDDGDAFGLEGADRSMGSKKSAEGSETDKKLIEEYQSEVAELREKLNSMEDGLKQKDDELASILDEERRRSQVASNEREQWADLQRNLESKVMDAQNLNDSLQAELDRLRTTQTNTERELRNEIDDLRVNGVGGNAPNLERENYALREQLKEQETVTEEVRHEAQEFLREMRMLSERGMSAFDREEELSNTILKLEDEVTEWRNRYARTKTQLRSLRASSIGLTIQQDAAIFAQDSGFVGENGLVADVHVTKFQIAIDELLRVGRSDDPSRVMEFMKSVVVSVRKITQDIDEAPTPDAELSQLQARLKSRVSATANNLITASKNFAAAKGLSPVSLLDAAASHLTAAVVELVRTVKIRPTPAGELDDDDDGKLTPVDPTGFFPVSETKEDLDTPRAPPFLGLRDNRVSTDSSLYSPINSPRDSTSSRLRSSGRQSRGPVTANGQYNANGYSKDIAPAPMGVGFGIRTEQSDVEELKLLLEDQTAFLVQNIQALVSSIRSESGITAISNKIASIGEVVGRVVSSTETAMSSTGNVELRGKGEPIVRNLASCRERLLQAGEDGRAIADAEREDDEGEREWRLWNQSLPPIAFEIARETKELVALVDLIDSKGIEEGNGGGALEEDFS